MNLQATQQDVLTRLARAVNTSQFALVSGTGSTTTSTDNVTARGIYA